MSEFTKIYGEPQTEAEKYMFIAVQSVLQNGGTPIVARMPYDNKQCKAYKALKMKWIDQTDLIAPKKTTDLASPIIPLSTLTQSVNMNKSFKEIFSEQNHVTLNNQPMSAALDDNGNNLVENITLPQALMLLNPYQSGDAKSGGEIYPEVEKLTGLKINGVYPSSLNIDQEAVKSMVESLSEDTSDRSVYVYKYDEGYNNIKFEDYKEIENGFLDGSSSGAFFSKMYLKVMLPPSDDETSGDSDDEIKANEYFLVSLFTTEDTAQEVSGLQVFNANRIPEDQYEALKTAFSGIFTGAESELISTYLSDEKYNDYGTLTLSSLTAIEALYAKMPGWSEDAADVDYIDLVKGDNIGYYDFTGKKPYIVPTSARETKDGESVPVYNIGSSDSIASLLSRAHVLAEDASYKNASGQVDEEAFIEVFKTSFDTVDSFVTNGSIFVGQRGSSNDSEPKYEDFYLDTLLPVFKNTQNYWVLEATVDEENPGTINYTRTNTVLTPELVKNGDYEILYFINMDQEAPAIEGTLSAALIPDEWYKAIGYTKDKIKSKLKSDDPTWPVFNASKAVGIVGKARKEQVEKAAALGVDKAPYYIPGLNGGSFGIDKSIKSGLGKYSDGLFTSFYLDGCNVRSIKYWPSRYIYSLKDCLIKTVDDDMIIENESLLWLKTIYNDTRLLNLDDDQYTLLEAKLLETPEMGFKKGLYLDSEDVEISNDQFDDLVTVNQFKAVDRSIDKYGQDIDDANFIIVDKQKTVVQGTGGNIGFFTVVIDPFDALKVQRTLVNPAENGDNNPSQREVKGSERTQTFTFDHSDANIHHLDYWAYESADSWNQIYEELLDSMDCLQRVRNADGVYIGEPNPVNGKLNILDSWSVPLTGGYYEDSISKQLMRKFPNIPMSDITSETLENKDVENSIIDHNFATHVMVAVCKTTIDQSNGKIVVNIVETFFGSLFDERDPQNGRSLFIGDIINGDNGSDYIQFYRNDYVSAGDRGAYDPPEYRRTDVNQIFIKDSEALKNAAAMRGIDYEDYGCDALDPEVKAKHEAEYYADLHKYHIWEIDKKEVCVYNLHWEANLTSFSKKESQKVIANTTGLYSVNDGTTVNIANNFIIDMDRCIKFIKNVDAIPLHFVCDAGLSTIAQFCDNVVWNPRKKSVVGEETDPNTGKKTGVKIYETTGGWITQPFDPDNDPDGDDRYITGYEDIATWRKVVEKLTSIAQDIRKDCFVIVDAPRQLTLDGAAPKIRVTKFTNKFDKVIGKALRYITGFNSSYVAGYYNWLRTTDVYTGKSIWIPPTSKIIGNYCYLNISNLPWLAPAGLTYGLISGCHAVSHNPDPQEEDQIYMKSWNYVKQYPLEGLVVEGQRTLLGKQSHFERVNVRLLFLDLERYAYNVSRTFKYQVNNAYTREQFVATLKPKFEDYTLRGGIYQYYIKVDDTNNTPETIDNNELRGDIFIKPARLIEFVLLNFVATSTGFDFSELQLG